MNRRKPRTWKAAMKVWLPRVLVIDAATALVVLSIAATIPVLRSIGTRTNESTIDGSEPQANNSEDEANDELDELTDRMEK